MFIGCRRKYIAYATEPVIGSLANIMGSYPSDISKNHMKVLEASSKCTTWLAIKL